jgi:hypothetical protein
MEDGHDQLSIRSQIPNKAGSSDTNDIKVSAQSAFLCGRQVVFICVKHEAIEYHFISLGDEILLLTVDSFTPSIGSA